jgi:chromosome transmission fidelity protein 18
MVWNGRLIPLVFPIQPPTDFFGRPIPIASEDNTDEVVGKSIGKKFRVRYQYHEGNSAAVRKPVKIAAFL